MPSPDVRHMRRALRLAERAWARTDPNPLVGAVVVRDGVVVGEGWHREYGAPHAEPEALAAAGDSAVGSTLYVTLEPCNHWGKTPPCTEAILAAGVRRVVFAAPDPNPAAAGGAERLAGAGVEVVGGVEQQSAQDLNAPFFHRVSAAGAERPWVTLKLATTLDGAMADADGRSQWITGPKARQVVHRLRAGHDAVAVGIGTAQADDPALTVRGPFQPRVAPVRVVFDRKLRLPPSSALARTAREVPVWIVADAAAESVRREALESAGVRVFAASDLRTGLRRIRDAGVTSLFCEGGPTLAAALLDADLVDRLEWFTAPLLLGQGAVRPADQLAAVSLNEAVRWRRLAVRRVGPDTWTRFARR